MKKREDWVDIITQSKICLCCGDMFLRTIDVRDGVWARRVFCSRDCYTKAETGVKHSQESIELMRSYWTPTMRNARGVKVREEQSNWWKGGVSGLYKRITGLWIYREWVRLVKERDNYTCKQCGKKDCRLEVHHIKPIKIILEEYDIQTLEQAIECMELWDTSNGKSLCRSCHKRVTDLMVLVNEVEELCAIQ